MGARKRSSLKKLPAKYAALIPRCDYKVNDNALRQGFDKPMVLG